MFKRDGVKVVCPLNDAPRSKKSIPRIVLAAPQSGSGKTTLTCGILAALRHRGLRVQAYKVGPDYIDPGYLAQASGRPAHNLDTWLLDEDTMLRVFAQTSSDADLAIVEGVMGLYDGGRGGVSSTALISKLLKSPVVLVIDCKSMGESAAALACGFRDYDSGVKFRGVMLNRLGSASHRDMLSDAMKRKGIAVFGSLMRNDSIAMPERHLGLLPTSENEGHTFDPLIELIEKSVDLDSLVALANSAEQLDVLSNVKAAVKKRATIAVANDQAFSFYYPESLEELENAGAKLVFFSPIKDAKLPNADGLILGGGFPEMFAYQLAANESMRNHIAGAAKSGMPIYAECGGYMYLTRCLTDFDGKEFPMAGIIPATCAMTKRLQTVGYVTATAQKDTALCAKGTAVRGHEFHFSVSTPDAGSGDGAAWIFKKARTGAEYAAGYTNGNVVASYLHMHFAGNPALARRFVDSCEKFSRLRDKKS